MSTKIYTAYRFHKSLGLFDTMAKIREDGVKVVKKRILEWYVGMMKRGKTLDEVDKKITQLYKEAVVSPERHPFNFDLCITIHEHEDYYYLIPYGVGYKWDFIKNNPQLEEFGYWDNTDKPENISDEDWDERERIWNDIINAGWTRQLVCSINDFDDYWCMSPYFDLKKEEVMREEKIKNGRG